MTMLFVKCALFIVVYVYRILLIILYDWAKVSKSTHTYNNNIRLSWSKRTFQICNFPACNFNIHYCSSFNFVNFKSNECVCRRQHTPTIFKTARMKWNERCKLFGRFQPSLANDPFPSRWSQFSPSLNGELPTGRINIKANTSLNCQLNQWKALKWPTMRE